MRTTLILPDDLMQKVSRLSGQTSKTRAVVAAMETYVKLKSREELLALRGKIQIEFDWERREEEELNCQRQREALLEGRREKAGKADRRRGQPGSGETGGLFAGDILISSL